MLDAEDRYGSEDRYWRLDGMWCVICSLKSQNVEDCTRCGMDAHLYHIVGRSILYVNTCALWKSFRCSMLRIVTDRRIDTGGLDDMG